MSEQLDWETAGYACGPAQRDQVELLVAEIYKRWGKQCKQIVYRDEFEYSALPESVPVGQALQAAAIGHKSWTAEICAAFYKALTPDEYTQWKHAGERVKTGCLSAKGELGDYLGPVHRIASRSDFPRIDSIWTQAGKQNWELDWLRRFLAAGTVALVPLEESCVVLEAPLEMHIDRDGHLHCEDGPAARYSKEEYYYWRGTACHPELIVALEEIKPYDFARMAEHERLIYLERMGPKRFLEIGRGEVVDANADYTLWVVDGGQFEHHCDDSFFILEKVGLGESGMYALTPWGPRPHDIDDALQLIEIEREKKKQAEQELV